ncbi:unnamed protein product, partial [Tenebrio molitor]
FSRKVHHLVHLYRETGSVGRKEGSGRPKVRNEENIETVRQVIEEQPNTSIRHLQQQVDLDESWFHLYVNSQNMRMWSGENPHYYIEVPLHSQKLEFGLQ